MFFLHWKYPALESKAAVSILSIGFSCFGLETEKRLIFAKYDLKSTLFEKQSYWKVILQLE